MTNKKKLILLLVWAIISISVYLLLCVPYDIELLMPLPKTKQQRFVHMCDLLASKKFLNIKFDGNEIVE